MIDWNREFSVTSITRADLKEAGFTDEQIAQLTDEDMQAIAEQIADMVIQEPIEQIAEFVARLYIAEKGGSSGSTEPMRQDHEA